jgi:hypothetical protein
MIKRYTEIMKESGASQKVIDNGLTAEEKEVLEEDAFLTKQRERYGKTKAGDETRTKAVLESQYGEMH